MIWDRPYGCRAASRKVDLSNYSLFFYFESAQFKIQKPNWRTFQSPR